MSQVPHNAAMVLPNSNESSGPLYTLEELPTSHFQDTNTECNICRCADAADVDNADAALLTQIVRIDLCSHIFHRICLSTWLDEQARDSVGTCPMCRRVLAMSTGQGAEDMLQQQLANIRGSVDVQLLTSTLAEAEAELMTLNEEMAQAQTTLDNGENQRTVNHEQVAQAFHQVELFETEMRERMEQARLSRDVDLVRAQQLDQEVREMRPRMGALVMAFTRVDHRAQETERQARSLSFDIVLWSHEALHVRTISEAIRETLLSLESNVDQAQA